MDDEHSKAVAAYVRHKLATPGGPTCKEKYTEALTMLLSTMPFSAWPKNCRPYTEYLNRMHLNHSERCTLFCFLYVNLPGNHAEKIGWIRDLTSHMLHDRDAVKDMTVTLPKRARDQPHMMCAPDLIADGVPCTFNGDPGRMQCASGALLQHAWETHAYKYVYGTPHAPAGLVEWNAERMRHCNRG